MDQEVSYLYHHTYLAKLLAKHASGEAIIFEDLQQSWNSVSTLHKDKQRQLQQECNNVPGDGERSSSLLDETLVSIYALQQT